MDSACAKTRTIVCHTLHSQLASESCSLPACIQGTRRVQCWRAWKMWRTTSTAPFSTLIFIPTKISSWIPFRTYTCARCSHICPLRRNSIRCTERWHCCNKLATVLNATWVALDMDVPGLQTTGQEAMWTKPHAKFHHVTMQSDEFVYLVECMRYNMQGLNAGRSISRPISINKNLPNSCNTSRISCHFISYHCMDACFTPDYRCGRDLRPFRHHQDLCDTVF